ncbi:AI-2E family transporter [Crenobacter cavernae]|uniref:AI-2E family transporter n=1 Tax=Crenobacter cavernae TaxID=2290923 RepID=A0A345Y883_9NEIS|nr:AI-2E family transporter [Crenobacter cavernae]AXK40135.1 AI-2E family transporter [Crenobacter cavernae]
MSQSPRPLPYDVMIRTAAIALLTLACFRVILPFLGALTWAGIIALSAWPVFVWLRDRLGGRKKTAALTVVLALALALIAPLTLMVLTLADAVPQATRMVSDLIGIGLPPPPAWLTSLPFVGQSLSDLWQSTHSDLTTLFARLKPYINEAALWTLGQGAAFGKGLLELVIAVILSGVLLAYGDPLWDVFERIVARLGGRMGGELPELVARTVRGVTTGVVGTALVQALLALIGFWISGVPGALVLGIVCFIVAIAQLPTLLVWVPATIWLFYSGDTGYAIFLGLWGALLVQNIDNFLKPYLISQGAGLPLPLIFLGVIGGLLAWGMIGLFLGPTVLAVGYSVFGRWLQQETPAATVDEAAEESPD